MSVSLLVLVSELEATDESCHMHLGGLHRQTEDSLAFAVKTFVIINQPRPWAPRASPLKKSAAAQCGAAAGRLRDYCCRRRQLYSSPS